MSNDGFVLQVNTPPVPISKNTRISEDVRAVICVGEVRVGQGKISEQVFNDALQSHLAKFDKGLGTSEQEYLLDIGIQHLVLLSNTTNICHKIFSRCNDLTFVDFRAVKKLNANTFSGLKKLKTVLLWDGLEVIGRNAFDGSGLESFTAPASLKKIEKNAFKNCLALKHVDFSACTL